MDRTALLGRIDERACLEFLAGMARQKSYTETEGEQALVRAMGGAYAGVGDGGG